MADTVKVKGSLNSCRKQLQLYANKYDVIYEVKVEDDMILSHFVFPDSNLNTAKTRVEILLVPIEGLDRLYESL